MYVRKWSVMRVVTLALCGICAVLTLAATKGDVARWKSNASASQKYAPAAPMNPSAVFAQDAASQGLLRRAQSGAILTMQEKEELDRLISQRDANKPRNPLDNQGGPDGYGYVFVDNQNGDTATYTWVELRGDANASWADFGTNHDDAVATNLDLGLTFPFYGNSYTTFAVGTNGDIQFSTSDGSYNNGNLPNTGFGTMGPAIFAYWDDLHQDYGGNGVNSGNTIAYRNFGSYTVIEWDSIGHCCSDGTSLKFEAILYSSGKIKFQYNTMTFGANTLTSTIGIQADGVIGSNALEYVVNGSPADQEPADGRAVWFALPNGVPLPVTNLQNAVNGSTVTLTWTDPTHDTNGNLLTPDSILIYRGAVDQAHQVASIGHGVGSYVALNQPDGNHGFYVRAKAGAWMSSVVSTFAIVGTPGYSNNFDTDNGAWTADGGWTWGAPTNPQAPAPHSGANMWGVGMDANYNSNQCYHLDLNPGLAVISPTATVEFWAWWSMYPFGPYDGVNLKVSTDQGSTWENVQPQPSYFNQPIYTFNQCMPGDTAWTETSSGWHYVVIPIGQFQNQTPMFRLTFGSYLSGYPGFFFDDVTIWGIATPPDGIPRTPTNLAGSSGGTNTVTLTWTDPDHDTNGNLLTPDSILIYRSNAQPTSQIGHVAGGLQTAVLTNEPSGNLTYCIRAKHGTYVSLFTCASVIVGTPAYNNNFELNDGAWVADGGWTWGAPTNTQAPPPHGGTNMWGVGMDANYNSNQCNHLDLNLGLDVISPTATVEFWAWWSMYPFGPYDGVNFKVSVDGGNTWETVHPLYPYFNQPIYTFTPCMPGDSAWTENSNGWHYVVLPIGQYINQAPIFRFTFGSYLSGYPGFFFDDMTIWGLHPIQGATVSGTVTLDGGAGDVTQTTVTANGYGGISGHPAANGQYSLANVQVGTRRLIATLANYFSDTLSFALDSTGHTGANMVLRRLPPPAPTNAIGVVRTIQRKDSLHWDVSPDALVDGYRVYRRIAGNPDWGTPRLTVLTRNHNYAVDTMDVEGIFEYSITAIDTNVTNPPSESAHSNTVRSPFGHLPPQALMANGNFDNKIHLTWVAPGAETDREVYYDDGVNTGFGLRWLGQVTWGYFVAHFQTNTGPATITRLKIYFTGNATVDDPIEVAVFADTGNGTPASTPLRLFTTTQQPPFDAFRIFELDTPLVIENGSFFVGARQITANGLCIGDENTDPMINNTFYAASSVGFWSTFESLNLMAIPMIRCFVRGDIGGNLLADREVGPSPIRLSGPVMKTPSLAAAQATGFLANSSKTVRALQGAVGVKGAITPKQQHAVACDGATCDKANPWYIQDRIRTSVGPRAPYAITAQTSAHGRSGRTLDDVVRYLIYRDNVVRDSVAATVTEYDDIVGSTNENHLYSYTIKARWDDNVLSANSDTVSARCNMAPGAPTNVALTPVGQTQMRITWNDPNVNADGTPCVDLAGIKVYRDGNLISQTPVAPGVQQYTDTPPDPAGRYTWTVKGVDEVPNESAGASASGGVVSPWHSVEYNWVDISTVGTQITTWTGSADDGNAGPFDLGFQFPFYGQNYSTVNVGTNGFTSFTSTSTSFSNTQLPSPNTFDPTCGALPLWDDLTMTTSGACYYYADATNHRFVVEWLNVPMYPSNPPVTFEVIFDDNGGITYQYQTLNGDVSATIGVVNCDNTQAIQLCYDGAGDWCPTDNSAVQFWGGPRQAITGIVRHLGGSNPPLVNAQVWVTGGQDTILTDNAGNYTLPVDPGTYTVHFRHPTHCDSIRPNIVVEANVNTTLNVSMRAPATPGPSVSSLTFVVHRNTTQPQTFTLSNNGTCPLHFTATDSVTWLSSSPATGDIDPGQTVTITVTAAPGLMQVGEYHSTISINGNVQGSPFLVQVDMNVLTVDLRDGLIPTEFALHANYPNPFNPSTLLPFDVPKQSHVDIVIYNLVGQEVARPVSGEYGAGRYQVHFDAGDLPSGVYLVKMTAGGFTAHSKMMLLK